MVLRRVEILVFIKGDVNHKICWCVCVIDILLAQTSSLEKWGCDGTWKTRDSGKKKGNCTLKSTDMQALCMLSSLNIITFDTKFQEVCATDSQLRLWVLVINYCITSYHKLSALKQYISPAYSVSVGAWTRLTGSVMGKWSSRGLVGVEGHQKHNLERVFPSSLLFLQN